MENGVKMNSALDVSYENGAQSDCSDWEKLDTDSGDVIVPFEIPDYNLFLQKYKWTWNVVKCAEKCFIGT